MGMSFIEKGTSDHHVNDQQLFIQDGFGFLLFVFDLPEMSVRAVEILKFSDFLASFLPTSTNLCKSLIYLTNIYCSDAIKGAEDSAVNKTKALTFMKQ